MSSPPPDEDPDHDHAQPGMWENRLWVIVPAIYLVAITIYATVAIVLM